MSATHPLSHQPDLSVQSLGGGTARQAVAGNEAAEAKPVPRLLVAVTVHL